MADNLTKEQIIALQKAGKINDDDFRVLMQGPPGQKDIGLNLPSPGEALSNLFQTPGMGEAVGGGAGGFMGPTGAAMGGAAGGFLDAFRDATHDSKVDPLKPGDWLPKLPAAVLGGVTGGLRQGSEATLMSLLGGGAKGLGNMLTRHQIGAGTDIPGAAEEINKAMLLPTQGKYGVGRAVQRRGLAEQRVQDIEDRAAQAGAPGVTYGEATQGGIVDKTNSMMDDIVRSGGPASTYSALRRKGEGVFGGTLPGGGEGLPFTQERDAIQGLQSQGRQARSAAKAQTNLESGVGSALEAQMSDDLAKGIRRDYRSKVGPEGVSAMEDLTNKIGAAQGLQKITDDRQLQGLSYRLPFVLSALLGGGKAAGAEAATMGALPLTLLQPKIGTVAGVGTYNLGQGLQKGGTALLNSLMEYLKGGQP